MLTCPALLCCHCSCCADVAEYVNQLCDGITALYRCALCLHSAAGGQPLPCWCSTHATMHVLNSTPACMQSFYSCCRVVSADAPDMVRLLLESGADPAIRVKDRGRWTSALHLAAQHK